MHVPVLNQEAPTYLPDDPLPGQIVEIPEDVDGGSVTHLTLYRDDNLVGESYQLHKIENVSRKWQLGRTVTSEQLRPEERVTLLVARVSYESLIFIEYFGWVGHKLNASSRSVTSNKTYQILHVAPYGEREGGPYIYELVCLHALDEGDKQ